MSMRRPCIWVGNQQRTGFVVTAAALLLPNLSHNCASCPVQPMQTTNTSWTSWLQSWIKPPLLVQ